MNLVSHLRQHWFDYLLGLLCFYLVLLYHTITYAQVPTQSALGQQSRSQSSLNQSINDAPTTGQLTLHGPQGSADLALLKDTRIDATITGMQARVIIKQQFENTSEFWVEGEYLFPLPQDSAVDYMAMIIGERRIIGKIREKEQAKKIYQQAKKAGKKASLVTQQRANLFRNRVANIAPGETIEVELHYLQTLHYDQGQFSLRFPTTITPRYIPGQLLSHLNNTVNDNAVDNEPMQNIQQLNPLTGWALPTDQVNDADLITPPMSATSAAAPLYFSASVDAGVTLANVESLYHPIRIQQQGGRYQIDLAGKAQLNRDLVLRWTPQTGQAPAAALFYQRGFYQQGLERENILRNDDTYLSLMVLPPQDLNEMVVLPKETIFVIDTSGSMAGNSIEQAKSALLEGMGKLKPQDRFNIIEFNSSARPLWLQAHTADNYNLGEAERFIKSLRADGGTQMASALTLALSDDAPEGYVRQVIFITDGSVGNEAALFDLISHKRNNSRIFTVGIGSAPNSFFMQRAAEVGRGSFTYIGALADIRQAMGDLFFKLQNPVMSNVNVDFGGADVEIFPRALPDLYAGEPLLLTAKINGPLPNYVLINGQRRGQPFQQQMDMSGSRIAKDIDKLWARQKIRDLSDQMRQQANNARAPLQQAITDLALHHQLMSKFTSFIAVEEVPSRPLDQLLAQRTAPNAMPSGNTMKFPLARTALGLKQLWLIALLAMAALLLWNVYSLRHERSTWQQVNAKIDS